jgi:hypothetical protein
VECVFSCRYLTLGGQPVFVWQVFDSVIAVLQDLAVNHSVNGGFSFLLARVLELALPTVLHGCCSSALHTVELEHGLPCHCCKWCNSVARLLLGLQRL